MRAAVAMFLAFATLVVLAGGCARTSEEPITVLVDENEGFFERDAHGQPMGFEFELLQSFAEREQRQLAIEWIDDFETLLPALNQTEGDAIAAGTLTITPERSRIVDFTEPYMPTRVLVLSDLNHPYSELSDLEGARIVTLPGTTYEAVFTDLPNVTLIYVDNDLEMFRTVADGGADAFGCDSSVVAVELQKYENLRIRFSASGIQYQGFAVKRGSRLKASLDMYISELKRTDDFRALLARHFGYLGLAVVEKTEEAEG